MVVKMRLKIRGGYFSCRIKTKCLNICEQVVGTEINKDGPQLPPAVL